MSSNIYNKQILESTVFIKPFDLNRNINDILELRLREKVEGVCLKEGFVKLNSSKILSRTVGLINTANFDGNTYYDIKYEAEVCCPKNGDIIECKVLDNNKSSVNAYVEDEKSSPLNIFLARQHHQGNSTFVELQKEDIITIKVIAIKYEYLDRQILVLGEFLDKKN
jgi:DNA-directed RNA polymerase subunit E'/Rpb7